MTHNAHGLVYGVVAAILAEFSLCSSFVHDTFHA